MNSLRVVVGKRRATKRSANAKYGRETRSRPSSSRNTPGSSKHVNNNGDGQVNHVNTAVNHESAPRNATNNARDTDNVTEAGSSTQPETPAHVAAAASNSSGGPCVQAVNLAHGIPGEFASRPTTSTVASNVSGVSTALSGGIISQAKFMRMAEGTRREVNNKLIGWAFADQVN